MEKLAFQLSEAYPEVTSCHGNNQHDIACIRPLYAGNLGEVSGIMQYVYQHVVLAKGCADVSEIMKHIAMVEMHHMHCLAEAICTLGGDPKYWNTNTNSLWCASAVCYEKGLCKALLKNLKGETEAHKAYLTAATNVKNQSLAALLRRIACDEKLHIEIFTQLINRHCRHN